MKFRLFFSFIPLLLLSPAYAGGLRISPVNLYIDAQQQATGLSIFNQSSDVENIQIRVFSWTQDASGNDTLSTTEDVVVSPAVARIEPNSSFNFRVVRPNVEPSNTEKAYRVVIDELPKAIDSRKTNGGGNVNMLLRTLLPLFIGNDNLMQKQTLTIKSENNSCILEASNTGQRHILLQRVSVKNNKTGQQYPIDINPTNGYIFPVGTKNYVISGLTQCTSGEKFSIDTIINGKAFQY